MVTDTRLEHFCVGPMCFRLAPSDLTFDDLEGSKIKITVFDVKYVENGKSYDVGPNEHDFRSHRQQQPGPFAEVFSLLFYIYSYDERFYICETDWSRMTI